LTETHGVGDLARSIMEGVAYEVRACVGLLEAMGQSPREVVAVGGGARSALWDQILADVLGRRVGVPRQTDAASLGAMLLAGAAIGRLREINPVAEAFVPTPHAAERYGSLYDTYNRLYQALRPVFHESRRGSGQRE